MTGSTPDALTEARWIEAARAGDLEAFDALVRLHFPRIYALTFRMIGNHEDAEDLAQECFLRAQSSLRWFRGEANFSTWLYRIALHLTRDHFRSRARRSRSQATAEPLDPPTSRPGPLEENAQRELLLGMRACLERLPHKLRAALVLRTQEGMEYDEIAEVLGVSPQTARVQVMHARRRLEEWLRPWTQEGESC